MSTPKKMELDSDEDFDLKENTSNFCILDIPKFIINNTKEHEHKFEMQAIQITPQVSIHTRILSSKDCLEEDVYEGGFKIWECALDLCKLIETSLNKTFWNCLLMNEEVNILELGCGHALPMISFIRQCVPRYLNKEVVKKKLRIAVQDLNEEVLKEATIPNLMVNCKEMFIDKDIMRLNERKCWEMVGVSGNWRERNMREGLEEICGGKRFVCILGSETVYNLKRIEGFVGLLKEKLLDERNGMCLLSAKGYYFGKGLGGGTQTLKKYIREREVELDMKVYTLKRIETGFDNIREIVCIVNKGFQYNVANMFKVEGKIQEMEEEEEEVEEEEEGKEENGQESEEWNDPESEDEDVF